MDLLTHYFIALLATGFVHLSLAIFILLKGIKNRINQTYALYSASIAIWAIFEAYGITAHDRNTALLLWRINHMGVIFIPIGFVHFVYCVVNITGWKRKLIPVSYMVAFMFVVINCTKLLILEVVPKFSFRYFINPGTLYYVFFSIWVSWIIYGLFELFKAYFKSSGARRNQLKYFCWSMLVAYAGGVPNFFPTFNIQIPIIMPFGTYAIPAYAFFTVYAIIKYRLMNINIVFTRATIFAIVYLVVLGIPFEIGIVARPFLSAKLGVNWWIAPSLLLALLSTIGPYVYLYLQRRAEDIILKDQRRYQEILRKAAKGMILIKDSSKLQKLIVHIIAKTIPIAYTSIYLYDERDKNFVLKASRGNKFYNVMEKLDKRSSIIECLFKMKRSIFIEDLKNANNLKGLEKNIVNEAMNIARNMNATLIIPSFIEDELMGFLVLGDKISGHSYTDDDLSVLSVLTNQAALAIENAQFYEKSSKEIAEKSERKGVENTTIGASHQIKNTLGIIKAPLQALHALITRSDMNNITAEKSQSILNIAKERLEEVFDEIEHGRKTINAILYGEEKDETIKELNIHSLADRAIDRSIHAKSKDFVEANIVEPVVTNDIPPNFPTIIGGGRLIEESLVNIINNSFDAIMDRYTRLKPDSSYGGMIKVTAEDRGKRIRINVEDNGAGMDDETKEKIFGGLFTTKRASDRGFGAGLFSLKGWIEKCGGNVTFTTAFGKGSTFTIELPKEQEGVSGAKDNNSR